MSNKLPRRASNSDVATPPLHVRALAVGQRWLKLPFAKKTSAPYAPQESVMLRTHAPSINADPHAPKPLPLIGRLSVKSQHNVVIGASVLLLAAAASSAFVANTLSHRNADVHKQIESAVQKIQQLKGEVQGAAGGDAESFMRAEASQREFAEVVSGLASYARLSPARVLSLPVIDQPQQWSDRLWNSLAAPSIDLTHFLESTLRLQDAFSQVLTAQPQFGAFGVTTSNLRAAANRVSDLLKQAQAGGLQADPQLLAGVEQIRLSATAISNSGGNILDMADLENARQRVLQSLPPGGPASVAAPLQSMLFLLKEDLPQLQGVVDAGFTRLVQTLSLDMSRAASEADRMVSATEEYGVGTPPAIVYLWSAAAALFLLGLATVTTLMAINAKAASVAAFESGEQTKKTDHAVRTMMQQLKPISKGDLYERLDVSEHELGSAADRVNVTIESLQEIMQIVKASTRDAEGAIAEIFQEAGKAKAITENMALQAVASREASEHGSQAVIVAAGRAEKQRVSMQDVAKRVKRLAEVAQSITRVTDLIEEITSKTEVLAINTSLRAADAGEEGAAFRVIAEEIRKLANDTKRSLVDIVLSVQSMQGETQSVIQTVEGVTADVVDSAQHWEGAMKSLESIRQFALQVDSLMAGVRDSTTSQAASATRAVDVITQLSRSATRFRTEKPDPVPAAA